MFAQLLSYENNVAYCQINIWSLSPELIGPITYQ